MIRAFWSDEDREYVAVDDDFPSLSWLAATEDEARAGLARLVQDIRAGRA